MFGTHVAYILPAYGISAIVILGLIVKALVGQRNLQREIAELENAGVRRRLGKPDG